MDFLPTPATPVFVLVTILVFAALWIGVGELVNWAHRKDEHPPEDPQDEVVEKTVTVERASSLSEGLRMRWEDRWEQLKGKVGQTWGDLTDDDLDIAEGNYDELVSRIEEHTGETREEVEEKLGPWAPPEVDLETELGRVFALKILAERTSPVWEVQETLFPTEKVTAVFGGQQWTVAEHLAVNPGIGETEGVIYVRPLGDVESLLHVREEIRGLTASSLQDLVADAARAAGLDSEDETRLLEYLQKRMHEVGMRSR